MEPAATIIKRFGGAIALASLLGITRGSVHAWTWERARGGTDGRVPQKYHAELMKEARRQGFDDITAEFLVLGPQPQPAEAAE